MQQPTQPPTQPRAPRPARPTAMADQTVILPPPPVSPRPAPLVPLPPSAGGIPTMPAPPLPDDPWVAPAPPLVPRPRRAASRRGRRWLIGRIARWTALAAALLAILGGALTLHRLNDFGQAISSQPTFATQIATSGRVNVILLGYGGPGHDGPYLTDSILVISDDLTTGKTALISVPRDLWVQIPPNSGHYAKINDAYAYGMDHGGRDAAGALAAEKVSTVLGMATPYWISINFGGFVNLVDEIGGVDINVERAFNASLSPTYAPATPFSAGPQHMDGARALLYARARYCTPYVEGTDFARSARQQLLIQAIIDKLKSPADWAKIPGVLDALQPTLATNLSLRDALWFLRQAHLSGAQRIGLTNQNVLQDAVSSDGQDILVPQNGDWNLIPQYLQQQLGGS